MGEVHDIINVGKQPVLLKSNCSNENDEVQFLGRGIVSRPKATIGGIDLVAAIKARDAVDQYYDPQVLSSKSAL